MLRVLLNCFGYYFVMKVTIYFANCYLDKYKNMHWVPLLSYCALEVESADRDGIFKSNDLIREHAE